jgi:rhamnogalacturonan endolyase
MKKVVGAGMTAAVMMSASSAFGQRQMEYLSRGVVALNQGGGKAWVSWRMFATDPDNVAFNVYRTVGNGTAVKANKAPIADVTFFEDQGVNFAQPVAYTVRPIVNGQEGAASNPFTFPANAPVRPYLDIPVKTPQGYTPNDGSVADLDGDGDLDLVIHMAGRGHDNSQRGPSDPPILQGYKFDGTLLWTVNLGPNIREGAHYTQFMVYDLDGDGKAEVVCKTADGTTDGKGKVIGDASKRWANQDGYILAGPEYLTVFNGQTGEAMDTVKYVPPRHPDTENPTSQQLQALWGDGYGNRMDRFLACVAYLDGVHPSVVMCRGYYTRTTLAAWDLQGGKLKGRWFFDSDKQPDRKKFAGAGHHSLAVADVDGDGKDEIIYGDMAVNSDGTGRYSTGAGHGDTHHLSDLDPDHPGLEVFSIQERFSDAGMHMFDAKTGQMLWKIASVKAADSGGDKGEGPGRGVAFNIDPRYPGHESWALGAGMTGMYDAKGRRISDKHPNSCNFCIYWDGDFLEELLDRNRITKWNWQQEKDEMLLQDNECSSNNGSKSTPVISGDILGDWREEVIWRTNDGQHLRLYTTTIPTKHRLYTLLQDPDYRLSLVWQNVAYNQPPHPSFYLDESVTKAPPKPNIEVLKRRQAQ